MHIIYNLFIFTIFYIDIREEYWKNSLFFGIAWKWKIHEFLKMLVKRQNKIFYFFEKSCYEMWMSIGIELV